METVVQIAALCLVAAVVALVVRQGSPEQALALMLAASVGSFFLLTGLLGDLAALLKDLAAAAGVDDTVFVPLYKTIAIALVVKLGGSLCRDAGASGPAAALETGGAVCALAVAAPLLRAVLETLMELMNV